MEVTDNYLYDSKLGKLPGWLLRAAGDLFSAQNRVDSVINDEVRVGRILI